MGAVQVLGGGDLWIHTAHLAGTGISGQRGEQLQCRVLGGVSTAAGVGHGKGEGKGA